MLVEWRPRIGGHNFGDYLAILLSRLYTKRAWKNILENGEVDYHLIGSVLDAAYLQKSSMAKRKAVFLGCGYRGKALGEINPEVVQVAGVRGPLSRSAVVKAGLMRPRVIGDTAHLLPLIIPKKSSNSLRIVVPHINDPKRLVLAPGAAGCDRVADPNVRDENELIEMIDLISGAKFVLAGSLHAAIVAYCYRVPFAFFSDGHIDCPSKWTDWALSVGLKQEDVLFHPNLNSGSEWYHRISGCLRPIAFSPLIRSARRIGQVRFGVRARGLLRDLARKAYAKTKD